MSAPERAGASRPPAVAPARGGSVLVVAEQLRRAVPGGIGTYVEGLARGIVALGADHPPVSLLASRTRGADPLPALGLPVEVVGLPSRVLVKAWDLGLARVGRGRAVVHATSLAVPASAAPLVVSVHDLGWRHVPAAYPRRGRRWHEAALRRALRRAAAFVVPSAAAADELRALLPTTGGQRIAEIGYGADHLPPADVAGARRLLDRLGVEGEFLLTVGTLEPRKNLAALFDAYRLVRPSLPEPWPLVVVGPAGWGAQPQAAGSPAAGSPGMGAAPPDGVVLAGRVEPAVLAGLYGSCRCLAYVPLFEGYGLPVVEAMRLGAPVVASPVPSTGAAALVVDPHDVDAIAAGLVTAATDEAQRERLVAAGHVHVAEMTWAHVAAAHGALWNEIEADGR